MYSATSAILLRTSQFLSWTTCLPRETMVTAALRKYSFPTHRAACVSVPKGGHSRWFAKRPLSASRSQAPCATSFLSSPTLRSSRTSEQSRVTFTSQRRPPFQQTPSVSTVCPARHHFIASSFRSFSYRLFEGHYTSCKVTCQSSYILRHS